MTLEEQIAHYKNVRNRIYSAKPISKKEPAAPKEPEAPKDPKEPKKPQIRIFDKKKAILIDASLIFCVPVSKIMSENKELKTFRARRYAMWRFHKELKMSLPQIGDYFGKEHSTTLRAIRSYENSLQDEGAKCEMSK